jgi:uncharacterized protein (DUF433 family)
MLRVYRRTCLRSSGEGEPGEPAGELQRRVANEELAGPLRPRPPHCIANPFGIESWVCKAAAACAERPGFASWRTRMDYQSRIVRDPSVCGGQPVIKGTRVLVRTILASLAEGAGMAEIIEDFPTLKEEDVRAVIAFAAASAEEDLPVPEVPSVA